VLDSQKPDPSIDFSEANVRVREASGQTSPNPPGAGWEGKRESAGLLPCQGDQLYKSVPVEER